MRDAVRQKLDFNSYQPILSDINNYFEDQGFVGDFKTRLALTIGLIRRKCIGVVSGAGSGKTAVVDALLAALSPNQLYSMGSGSDKAQIYEADKINSADLIYITELQKLGTGDFAIEMLKNLGEGKDFEYKRTEGGGTQETTSRKIKSGKAMIYTKALENNFESDAELDRRFPRLTTDMSEAQNKRVINSKGNRRENPLKNNILSDKQRNALEYHLSSLLKENANKYVYVNPLAGFLSRTIPSTFAVARTYTDHYFDFMEGVAFYNKPRRIVKNMELNGKQVDVVFVAPEDCWQLHKIYSEQFLQDVLNIPPNGIHILNALKNKPPTVEKNQLFGNNDGRHRMTIHELFNALGDDGFNMAEPLIKKILTGLMMSGYVTQELDTSGTKKKEYFVLSKDIRDFQDDLDWKGAIEYATTTIKKEFPDIAEEYINRFCLNTTATDPWSGEVIDMVSGAVEGQGEEDARDAWIMEVEDVQ